MTLALNPGCTCCTGAGTDYCKGCCTEGGSSICPNQTPPIEYELSGRPTGCYTPSAIDPLHSASNSAPQGYEVIGCCIWTGVLEIFFPVRMTIEVTSDCKLTATAIYDPGPFFDCDANPWLFNCQCEGFVTWESTDLVNDVNANCDDVDITLTQTGSDGALGIHYTGLDLTVRWPRTF